MKVAVVVDELRPPELIHARAQAARLRRAGIGVVGICRGPSGEELDSISVIHGVGRGGWRSARRLARRHRAPVVYDHPPGTPPPRRLGHADAVIVPGPFEAAAIVRAGRSGQVVVVSPQASHVADGIKPRLRQRLGTEARTIALQEAAGLSLADGEAIVHALSSLAGVDLVFLGGRSWQHRQALAHVAVEQDLADRVHFVAAVPRTRRIGYLAQADVGLALAEESRRQGELPAADVFAMLGIPFIVAMRAVPDPAPANCIASEKSPTALASAIEEAGRRERLPAHDSGGPDLAAFLRDLVGADGFDELTAGEGARPRLSRGAPKHAARDERGMATVLLGEARTRHRAGEAEEAVRLYARVAAGDHGAEAVATAAAGLARLNAPAAASPAIERVIADPSRSSLAVARVAEAEAVLGKLPQAHGHLEEALGGETPPPAALRTAIRVLELAGEPRAALRLARRVEDETAVARIEGTLDSYDPTWLPDSGRGPGVEPQPGRSLVLLETSLPHARSGYTYRAQTLLRAQQRAGIEPVALTRLGFPANRGLSAPPSEEVDGVVHHRAGLAGVQNYTSVPVSEQLEENVRWAAGIGSRFRPEGIIAATPHLNGLLGLALRDALGIPLVYDVRGFPEMTWAVREGGAEADAFALRRIAETRCMREADLVTTLSETMRARIVSRGIPAERVFVLPHAVDTEAFAPTEPDEALGASLGLAGRPVVGYISSLVPYEGVATLLGAIDLARHSHPEIIGLIVGDGESLPSLEAQAHRLGLTGHVVFAGRVEAAAIARYYSLIDVFVCPREDHEVTRYVTPLKPFEAMAAGSCLAVSDLPTLREAVRGGECGALFPAGDSAALAATVCRLIDNPAERHRLADTARQHAVANHSFDRLCARTEEVWDELRRVA